MTTNWISVDKLCERCCFWKSLAPAEEVEGECHRRSPWPFISYGGPNGTLSQSRVWPKTRADDTCGEWQPLPEPADGEVNDDTLGCAGDGESVESTDIGEQPRTDV